MAVTAIPQTVPTRHLVNGATSESQDHLISGCWSTMILGRLMMLLWRLLHPHPTSLITPVRSTITAPPSPLLTVTPKPTSGLARFSFTLASRPGVLCHTRIGSGGPRMQPAAPSRAQFPDFSGL